MDKEIKFKDIMQVHCIYTRNAANSAFSFSSLTLELQTFVYTYILCIRAWLYQPLNKNNGIAILTATITLTSIFYLNEQFQ